MSVVDFLVLNDFIFGQNTMHTWKDGTRPDIWAGNTKAIAVASLDPDIATRWKINIVEAVNDGRAMFVGICTDGSYTDGSYTGTSMDSPTTIGWTYSNGSPHIHGRESRSEISSDVDGISKG